MDTTNTTTLSRAATASRDVGLHRRAYLDTYARRRAGLPDQALTVEPIQQVLQSAVQPAVQQQTVPQQQPAVIAIPTITQNSLQQQEQSFTYTPVTAQQKPVQAPRHKTYLDTLVHHHNQRVAQAPNAVETIHQPQLTNNTQHLIDIDAQNRISANLSALYNQKPLTEHITKNKSSASAAHIRTIVASAVLCGMLSVGIFAFTGRYDAQPVVAQPIGAPVIEVEAPLNSAPVGVPVASKDDSVVHADPNDPVRLIVSSIGVNARVDGLGTTPEGLIAVPKSYGTVGWYNKGSTPGKPGPAVMVGHYTGGYGGVFDKLQDLKDGDLITVKNGKGQSFTYKVTKKSEYEKDKVPMAEIFKKGDTSRLEIITCAGKWQSSTYNNRLVVSAELVQ
ncbi:class F sortase [Candidatus Saccharibacteria bacterium]|nr:class F sortase [Candidatus Saccharibacteria bacterium]